MSCIPHLTSVCLLGYLSGAKKKCSFTSNIAAVHSQDSEAGLFPQPQGILLPIVKATSNEVTCSQAQEVKALVEDAAVLFKGVILDSELLSRGWVYQEVLLTPANIFCTGQQMWWSCCRMSCSQTFPRGFPSRLGRDISSKGFSDSISHRKRGFCWTIEEDLGDNPLGLWDDIIKHYSMTTVTASEDRIVAIAGVAKVFASRFRTLQGAVCHSGVWSVNVLDQLLWATMRERHQTPYRELLRSTHPIPTWSPLSCQGVSKERMPLGSVSTPLAKYVSMATSGLDPFGRARGLEDCVLHLRGVLVDIRFDDTATRFYASSHIAQGPWRGPDAEWDTTEDRQTALSCSGHIFAAVTVMAWEQRWTDSNIQGLLLRETAARNGGTTNRGTQKTWKRCGYFSYNLWPKEGPFFLAAFQIRRYGLDIEFADDPGALRPGVKGCGKLKPTGEAPDLEDIYIV